MKFRWACLAVAVLSLLGLAHMARYEPAGVYQVGVINVWDRWEHRACIAVMGSDQVVCGEQYHAVTGR